MAFGMGGYGYGLGGYGGFMPTAPNARDMIDDDRDTRRMIRLVGLQGWTCTDGQSFGMSAMGRRAAMDHQSSIRDVFEGPLHGAGMHVGWVGMNWAGMNPLWAPHMNWITDYDDFRIFQGWQRHLNSTGQTAQQSREWLINHIMDEKYSDALFMLPAFRKLAETMADRMIAMSGNLAGNQHGRVELSQSANNTQQTTNVTTNTTVTTVTTQMRYDAANDFIRQVQSAGGSNMTQEQVQQAADQICNGQKDDWVRRNAARPKTPANQLLALPAPPAPPAPPQPAYNPPPAQVMPPAPPAQVAYHQLAPVPAQLPAQQATAGSSNFLTTATTTTSSSQQVFSSTSQQGQQHQLQSPSFQQQPIYTTAPQSPPAQQYLQPAQQPQQVTAGPGQNQYLQYNHQQFAQQQPQIAYAGAPQSGFQQQQSHQQANSPPPQYAGYPTDPAAGQYVVTSPPVAPDKPKKKKVKKADR